MGNLEPKRPRRPAPFPGLPPVPPKPDNLVAEIVDQITEKQARTARPAEIQPAASTGCTVCLEKESLAGTPYQAVLRCATDEPETS